MSNVFSDIGKIFTSGPNGGFVGAVKQNPLQAILAGTGFLSNWLNQRKYNGILDQQRNLQSAYAKMTPDQVATAIRGLQQPLSLALKQSVGNAVQGDLASRGLSSAPGIYAATEAQALAPYGQRNLENAMEAFFKMKQLPLQVNYPGTTAFRPQAPDLSGLIHSIMANKSPVSTDAGITLPPNTTPPTFPSPFNLPANSFPDLSTILNGGQTNG